MNIKVVLDTNIIVSAIVFGGKPRDIIDLIQEGEIEAYVSPFILYELEEVLIRKFDFNEEKLEDVKDLINQKFIKITPREALNTIKNHHPDNKILALSIEAQADYLITGDKQHLLPLKKIKKTKIVSPEDFLEIR